MVKLGVVSYLNTAPVFYALENHKVDCAQRLEFERGEPSAINAQFRLGRVDIAPVSSVEMREGDLVVPDMSISARGPVRSVALFSQRPLEELDGIRVGLTPASATAAALLKVICWEFAKVRPEFVLIKSCEEVEAALMIGDRCLVERSYDRWAHVLDLSQFWTKETGLPVTFALFMHRPRGDGLRKSRGVAPELAEVAQALAASRDWGLRNIEAIVDSVELPPRLGREGAVAYLRSLDYSFGPEHRKGLELLYSLVRKHGIGMPPEELRFIES